MDKAIELIPEDLKTNPGIYLERSPYPDKSKWICRMAKEENSFDISVYT